MATLMSRPMMGSTSGQPARHPNGSDDDGQGCEPIDAGVAAVCDQRSRADAASDADAVARHHLVARPAENAGERHGP